MGFDFKTNYEGVEFDPESMWFLPLRKSSQAERLGLRVGIRNMAKTTRRQAVNAVYVILDTALGERSSSSEIGPVEVTALPESPGDHGFLPLTELPRYLDSLRHSPRAD